MNRIPFRGGPQVVQDMIAGRVYLYASPTIAVVPQYQQKQLKLLATTSPTGSRRLPDVPTFKEKGIDYVRFGWLGFCAAKGTPQPILDRHQQGDRQIVATPEYQDLITKGGSLPEASTPEQLGQIITQTVTDVEGTIREFGLQQE